MPGVPLFEIHGNMVTKLTILLRTMHPVLGFLHEIKGYTEVIPIGSEKWGPLGVTGPSKGRTINDLGGPGKSGKKKLNGYSPGKKKLIGSFVG